MCNLSDGIEERTKETIALNMYKKGYSLEQIAEVTDIDVDAIETIIEKNEPVLVWAIKESIGQDKSVRTHVIKKS